MIKICPSGAMAIFATSNHTQRGRRHCATMQREGIDASVTTFPPVAAWQPLPSSSSTQQHPGNTGQPDPLYLTWGTRVLQCSFFSLSNTKIYLSLAIKFLIWYYLCSLVIIYDSELSQKYWKMYTGMRKKTPTRLLKVFLTWRCPDYLLHFHFCSPCPLLHCCNQVTC